MKRKISIKKRVLIFSAMLSFAIASLFAQGTLQFPDKINIYEGEELRISSNSPYSLSMPASFGGVLSDDGKISRDSFQTNEKYIKATDLGDFSASLKLFGIIPVKNVNVIVTDAKTLIPGGDTIGIKMFTEGLLCVGTSDIADINGNILNIASSSGIKMGDIILSANGKKLNTTEQLANIVLESGGKKIDVMINRENELIHKSVTPALTSDGYKIGIWMRDSTAGIGTLSYISPDDLKYGALGHPICDSDTGVALPVADGNIINATIYDVLKGSQGLPGELKGTFNNSLGDIGTIEKNTSCGIYGKLSGDMAQSLEVPLPVASKNTIKKGKAQIISTIDESGKKAYDVEILKVQKSSGDEHKDMVIKITDSRLLEKTGGIVQGMSGSPIIQNGKLVGAVTHVFVNDPTRGYGIFIENMLAEAE